MEQPRTDTGRQPDEPNGPDEDDVPTARDTGRSPRPSQAEGERETVEEDLADRE